MMPTAPQNLRPAHGGFTLIEMVVAIVIVSILTTLFVQVMGTALSDSATPINRERIGLERDGVMEKIISDYVRQVNGAPENALAAIKGTAYATTDVAVAMQYIDFTTDGVETTPAGTTDNLKVTVTGNGQSLTTVLTQSRNPTDAPVSY